MLASLKKYAHDRRQTAADAAGIATVSYLAVKFVREKISETRDVRIVDQFCQDNLKRRFRQSQQDVGFTIMALLPSLSRNILEGMDVEALTQELQQLSKASKARLELQMPVAPSETEPSPSGEMPHSADTDARSDNGSVSVVSYPSPEDAAAASDLSASSTSWVDQFSSQRSEHSTDASSSEPPEPAQNNSPESNVGTDLSGSFITESSAVSYGDVASGSQAEPAILPPNVFTRSKAELWKEVKMLTFTRTLTVLYSITLLSLFSHIQITLLGRNKYLQSIIALAHDERRQGIRDAGRSLLGLLFGGDPALDFPEDDVMALDPVLEPTERKYLTLTWWLLHVGWRDVGERVRRAVEEVFEGVSLKTKISATDLHRLLNDVRRRVEYEVTFEGHERRINFASTLLPPTPETLQHALVQGGIPPHEILARDRAFFTLLSETRKHVSSGSFAHTLEVCLDRSTQILLDGLDKNVFGTPSGGWEDPNSALGLTQEPRVRLAGMLPGLARWCHTALNGLPNELVEAIGGCWEVPAFCALVYSEWDDLLPE